MALFPTPGGPSGPMDPADANRLLIPEHRTRRLARILAFCGHDIDDVVDDPIAKRRVLHYFKLDKQINRRSEVVELERQWNPLGRQE